MTCPPHDGYPIERHSFGVVTRWAPSANYTPRTSPRTIRCVVWHIAEGTLDGTLSWLRSPRSEASSHYVVARDGDIYQLVRDRDVAWTNGDRCSPDEEHPMIASLLTSGQRLNDVSVTVECIGYSSHGRGGSLTTIQRDSLTRLTAHLCLKYSLTADRAHILGHSDWNSCTRLHCPGFSAGEWRAFVEYVSALVHSARGW